MSMMRLTQLEPHLLKIKGADTFDMQATFNDFDGILFLCPTCFQKNGGGVGTHSVICWKPHVDAGRTPGPGRWNMSGSSFENLTLTGAGGGSSVYLNAPGTCGAHFVIANGAVVPC